MFERQKLSRSGQIFGFLAIIGPGIFSATLCAAESFAFKTRTVTDKGFLEEAKKKILPRGTCSESGISKQNSFTHTSLADSNCDTQNHFVTGYHFTADNPHLRLDINLKRIEQQDIAGDGVQSTSEHLTIVDFNFDSLSADLVTPNLTGLLEFVGDTVALKPVPLFIAFIENGCVGSPPATFGLSLSSTLYGDLYKQHTLGSVQLYDEVVGHGYYNFNYTIRAEAEKGNISDFTFSGDANSTCVADLSVE